MSLLSVISAFRNLVVVSENSASTGFATGISREVSGAGRAVAFPAQPCPAQHTLPRAVSHEFCVPDAQAGVLPLNLRDKLDRSVMNCFGFFPFQAWLGLSPSCE